MLSTNYCRARQRRLTEYLSAKNLDGALITTRLHVYYYTGYLSHWSHTPAAYLDRSGRLTVVGWKFKLEDTAIDDAVQYPAHKLSTSPADQAHNCAAVLARVLPKGKKFGVDLAGPGVITRLAGEAPDINAEILRQRQAKDPDELEALKAAIAVTEPMYKHARESVRPGLDELELFAELRAVATRAAGKDLEIFGNDFRCGEGAGQPRRRPMQDGELYVLDLGPSLDGYVADNCRTFAVNRKPTDAQHKAWTAITGCLAHLEKLVKPGMEAVTLYRAADAFLKDAGYPQGMTHHLGHGIGLVPHEAPQFNPEFSAVVRVGDVFTFEPGLYNAELKGGIRLEHDYYLSEKGLERLSQFPLELA